MKTDDLRRALRVIKAEGLYPQKVVTKDFEITLGDRPTETTHNEWDTVQ